MYTFLCLLKKCFQHLVFLCQSRVRVAEVFMQTFNDNKIVIFVTQIWFKT